MRRLSTREKSMVLSLTAYADTATFIGHHCRAADFLSGISPMTNSQNCTLQQSSVNFWDQFREQQICMGMRCHSAYR